MSVRNEPSLRRMPWLVVIVTSVSMALAYLRYHWAVQGLVERRHKVLLSVDRDKETAALLGETLCFFNALFAGPRIALVPKTDDMNGELLGGVMKLLCKVAW